MLDSKLTDVISDVFGIEGSAVTPETGRETLEDWDSVGHLKLILSVEKAFGVRFPTREISNLTTAGQIQEALRRMSS